MKTLSIIVSILTIFAACKKISSKGVSGDILPFDTYFEFVKSENHNYASEGVEISTPLKKEANGELTSAISGPVSWQKMAKSEINYNTIFGPLAIGANVEEAIKYTGQPLTFTSVRLFRFNTNDQDTLRIVSTNKVTSQNTVTTDSFEVWYNDKKVSAFTVSDYISGRTQQKWVIPIQK